jgi:Glycine/D-amino acid oxidases (deaminating)
MDRLRALHEIATRAVPALREATVVAHWAGLRPMTPDGLPILGADPDHPQLLYACGYSRNGILLAPWAAERLAELLVGERPHAALERFTIERPREEDPAQRPIELNRLNYLGSYGESLPTSTPLAPPL